MAGVAGRGGFLGFSLKKLPLTTGSRCLDNGAALRVSIWHPMARKRLSSSGKVTRLEARTRMITKVNHVAFFALCVAGGFVVMAAAMTPKQHLDELQGRLREAESRERVVLAEKEDRTAEYRALKEDPAFLEIHARDRLDLAREGERVLRIKRGE